MKITKTLVFILLIFMSGCGGGYLNQRTDMCPEPIICPICDECVTCQVCEPVGETEYKEIIIREDENIIRAEIYLDFARKELSGYYDDFDKLRFESCYNKTNKGDDYILTAIGYYNLAKDDMSVKGYERYLKALGAIKNYCDDPNDKSKEDTEYEYEFEYNRYVDYMNYKNKTVVFIR